MIVTYELTDKPKSEYLYEIYDHVTGKKVGQVASRFYDEVRDYLVRMQIIPKTAELTLLDYIGVDRGK